MVKVTVIVPVYNVKNYLEECVYSILNQTIKSIEVILVDDGSTDGSQDICDKFGNENSNVIVIHKQNGGLSSARNAGMKVARGEYISFIDSDDYIEPETYEILLKKGERAEYDIISMARILLYENGTQKIVNKIENCIEYNNVQFLNAVFMDENIDMSVCDKIFRRECIMGLSFPEGYLSEDCLFLQYLIPRINKVLVTGIPLYYYRQRCGSITKSFNPLYEKTYKKMKVFKEFISKNYPACSKSFIVFQDTFLCHILLLLQTYHCNDSRIEEYLTVEFKKRFIVIMRNDLISKRIKIQCVFLKLGLGGLFSWLKMLYQRRFWNRKKN